MNEQSIMALCLNSGLSQELAQVLVACIHVESDFDQYAIHLNDEMDGSVSTIDYGICQVNDYFHIGTGKDFSTPEEVLSNPKACIEWMINLFKQGKMNLWMSYTSGAYKRYLPATKVATP